MIPILTISTGDLSISAEIRVGDSILDFRSMREIDLLDTGKEFILYLKSRIYEDIEIGRYKNKYNIAKRLSEITVTLSKSRIDFSYTKDFVLWLNTTKNY